MSFDLSKESVGYFLKERVKLPACHLISQKKASKVSMVYTVIEYHHPGYLDDTMPQLYNCGFVFEADTKNSGKHLIVSGIPGVECIAKVQAIKKDTGLELQRRFSPHGNERLGTHYYNDDTCILIVSLIILTLYFTIVGRLSERSFCAVKPQVSYHSVTVRHFWLMKIMARIELVVGPEIPSLKGKYCKSSSISGASINSELSKINKQPLLPKIPKPLSS